MVKFTSVCTAAASTLRLSFEVRTEMKNGMYVEDIYML